MRHYLTLISLSVDGEAQWKSCPLAGGDILKLKATKRPVCPYEQAENDLLTQLEKDSTPLPTQRYDTSPKKDPHPLLPEMTSLRENLKTLQIMITRAAAALKTGLTQDTRVDAKDYHMETSKPSAALYAYQILTREHRNTATFYEKLIQKYGLPKELKIVPFPKEYLETT